MPDREKVAQVRGEGLVLGMPGIYHYATPHDHGVSGNYGYGAQVKSLCERTSGIAYREDTLRNLFPEDRLCKLCAKVDQYQAGTDVVPDDPLTAKLTVDQDALVVSSVVSDA